jgi:hypothetical protein
MRVLSKTCILILVIACFTHCNYKQQATEKIDSTQSITAIVPKQKPVASVNDTISIAGLSAVFFAPDSIQLEQFRTENSPALFESTQHKGMRMLLVFCGLYIFQIIYVL